MSCGNVTSPATTRVAAYSQTVVYVWLTVGLDRASGPEQGDVELQVAYQACGKVVGAISEQLVATQGTTGLVKVVSAWLPAMEVAKIKAALVVNSATSNLRVRIVYRTAQTSKEVPSAWSTLGSQYDTGEENTGELTPTIGTQDMWVQIGLEYASSDANLAQGFVAAVVGVRK